MITVIVPIYERRVYLESCLRSILQNGCAPDLLDVIVVDNASPTPGLSEQVCGLSDKLTGDATRVRYKRWESNLGLYPSVNRAILNFVGAGYVHVLHEDDWVLPGFYDAIAKVIENRHDVGVISTAYRDIYPDGTFTSPPSLGSQEGVLGSRLIARLLTCNPIQVCSVVFRYGAFQKIGPFRPDLPHTADWEWYMRAALATDWYYIPVPLAVFRVHKMQDTYRNDRDGRSAHDIRRTFETFAELIPEQFSTLLRTGRTNAAQKTTADAHRCLQDGDVELAARFLTDALALLKPADMSLQS